MPARHLRSDDEQHAGRQVRRSESLDHKQVFLLGSLQQVVYEIQDLLLGWFWKQLHFLLNQI